MDENIINFKKLKLGKSIDNLVHRSLSEEAQYFNLHWSLVEWQPLMGEKGILAYVNRISNLRAKKYLFVIAATMGLAKVVQKFLKEGISPNTCSPFGDTALMFAACGGYKDVVELLLKAGADINYKDWKGGTALKSAVLFGQLEMVQYLIANGADLKALTGDILKDLDMLMRWKNIESPIKIKIIDVLLKNGANLCVQDKFGDYPIITASRSGWDEVVRIYIRYGASTEVTNNFGNTALMEAAWGGYLSIATILLDAKAEVDAQNIYGETALFRAVFKNHPEIIVLLIKRGANINAQDFKGNSPLSVALYRNSLHIMKVLISNGAELKIGQDDILVAYLRHLVVSKELDDLFIPVNASFVKFLLKKGAGVNFFDQLGKTPLVYASIIGDLKIVKMLLEYGADPNMRVSVDRLAISYAAERGSYEVFKELYSRTTLKEQKDKVDLFLEYVIWGKEPKIIKFLIEEGIDINSKSAFGDYGCLHKLCIFENIDQSSNADDLLATCIKFGVVKKPSKVKRKPAREAVEFLLNMGADINSKNKYGETPLMIATKYNLLEIAELLIYEGADVNASSNAFKNTALILAAENGNKRLVSLLLEHGAEVSNTNYEGYTAYTYAVYKKNIETIDVLKSYGKNEDFTKQRNLALILAAEKSNVDRMKELLNEGLDANVMNRCQVDPLTQIIKNSLELPNKLKLEIIRLLLEHGANPNVIHHVNVSDQAAIKIVRYLLRYGGDINSYDHFTPTILVSAVNNKKLTQMLLENGADVNYKDVWGDAALVRAVQVGNIKTVKTLLRFSKRKMWDKQQEYNALCAAIEMKNEELIKLFLRKRIDFNDRKESFSTPLISAVKASNISLVETLLKKGANINLQDFIGRTPLHIAVDSLNGKIVDILLRYKASTNVRNNHNETPYMVALQKGQEAEKIARKLIDISSNI